MNDQLHLLNTAPSIPIPGFTYLPEFITIAEEEALLRHIEAGVWSHEFARRRQHYGMDYSNASSHPAVPLPAWIDSIARRIVAQGFFEKMPVHGLVNEYEPGQGISAHRDYKPFDQVASLSLASGCLMEFEKMEASTKHKLWLEPRSLLVLVGEARYKWTHAIRPRLNDVVNGIKVPRQRRLSLTLRTITNRGIPAALETT
ncbi:MAG: hypothetical protein QOF48_1006 [Verrucomicrobiota bacterium]|jgi:alkylated DNA repair dioxygenase AlkB